MYGSRMPKAGLPLALMVCSSSPMTEAIPGLKRLLVKKIFTIIPSAGLPPERSIWRERWEPSINRMMMAKPGKNSPPPYEGSFFGVLPLQNGSMTFFGLRGNIFRYQEKGKTWEKVHSKTESSLLGGTVFDNGSVVLTGNGGVILFSEDNGKTFNIHKIEEQKGMLDAIQSPEGGLLVFGEKGVLKIDNAEGYSP